MRARRPPLHPTVVEALTSLGAGLKNMRARRRMPAAYAAERAMIARSTLYRVERGDPGVSLGVYAAVLRGYGMLERLGSLVDARWDRAGLALAESRLPRRIRKVPPL